MNVTIVGIASALQQVYDTIDERILEKNPTSASSAASVLSHQEI